MDGTLADVDPASPGAIPRLLSSTGTGASALLGLARRHASHVHEHGGQVGEARALRALAHVGTTFVGRSAALRVYALVDETPSGGIPERIERLEATFEAWADRHGGAGEWSLLGQDQRLLPSVARDLVMQVLGALCLEGRHEDTRSVLDEFFAFATSNATPTPTRPVEPDYRALLPADVREIDVKRSGPAHEPSFRSTMADARVRSAQGRGPSESAARTMAARRWLETYRPDKLVASAAPRTPQDGGGTRAVAVDPAHTRGLERAMAVLGVPADGRAVVSQALILPSWAHENARQMRAHRQRDHRALVAVGSWVLPYEYALLQLRGRDLRS